LHQAGVQLARPEPVSLPTSLAVVGLDAAGKASYSFYRAQVADRDVGATGLTQACDAIDGLQVVATGCLALVPDDAHAYLPWLRGQRQKGRLVVVDANVRPAAVADTAAYRETIMQALRQAHIIKASDDDLIALGLLDSGVEPGSAARLLLAQTGAAVMALTLGAEGAMWIDRHGFAWHARETTPVKVVDTVGAGDCFLAGLLAALIRQPQALAHLRQPVHAAGPLLESETVAWLLQHAVASASLCVQQAGCAPPTTAQVSERRQQRPARVTRSRWS
jgi:fructokinase